MFPRLCAIAESNKFFVFTLDFFVVFTSSKPFSSSFINAAARSRDEMACFARPERIENIVCVKSERDILNLSLNTLQEFSKSLIEYFDVEDDDEDSRALMNFDSSEAKEDESFSCNDLHSTCVFVESFDFFDVSK